MAGKDSAKTAFCSHSRLYEFTLMPFSLCNVPATVLRIAEMVLEGLAQHKRFINLDIILVVGSFHLRECLAMGN